MQQPKADQDCVYVEYDCETIAKVEYSKCVERYMIVLLLYTNIQRIFYNDVSFTNLTCKSKFMGKSTDVFPLSRFFLFMKF